MFLLGILFVIVGAVLSIPISYSIGIILAIVGAVSWVLGSPIRTARPPPPHFGCTNEIGLLPPRLRAVSGGSVHPECNANGNGAWWVWIGG